MLLHYNIIFSVNGQLNYACLLQPTGGPRPPD